MRSRKVSWLLFVLVGLFLIGCAGGEGSKPAGRFVSPATQNSPLIQVTPSRSRPTPTPAPSSTPLRPVRFDGERAFQHAARQMAFGDRQPGSVGNRQTGDYILSQLQQMGWAVEEQTFEYQGTTIRNIVGRAGEGPVVILGAHYDTRRRADRDPKNPDEPVPGANDGASGVAVLLELARALDREALTHQIWLVFFDAEDNGGLDGWEWIVGSTYMAEHLTLDPEYVIIVDMIGDTDQQIYLERNSDLQTAAQIWDIAAQMGYGDYFISEVKHSIIDDHTPFVRRGIPAVDIIDFDYPHWHTTRDTLDRISPLSLERVGRVLETLLEGQR